MNLTGQKPRQKQPKPIRDAKHLDRIRALPCAICHHHGGQRPHDVITAHHCISGRYGQRKACDLAAIPLCDGHHQGQWDNTKTAIHKSKRDWEAAYGPDTDYIEWTQEAIRMDLAQTI